jgi:hypothetical protein
MARFTAAETDGLFDKPTRAFSKMLDWVNRERLAQT